MGQVPSLPYRTEKLSWIGHVRGTFYGHFWFVGRGDECSIQKTIACRLRLSKAKIWFWGHTGTKSQFQTASSSQFSYHSTITIGTIIRLKPTSFCWIDRGQKTQGFGVDLQGRSVWFLENPLHIRSRVCLNPQKTNPIIFLLLVINTLIPLRFAYAQKQLGSANEEIIQWIEVFPVESNSITKGFSRQGLQASSALDSQALLQLKNFYCDKKRCLRCSVGFHLFDFSS